MATYQDFHRVIKETIQVDSDPNKRWTPQLVKFINHSNEFYGTFYGRIDAQEGLTASNCSLSNVNLSSCKLFDKDGNALDLDTIISQVSSFDYQVKKLTNRVDYLELTAVPELYKYVNDVSSGISVLIDEKISQSGGKIYQDLSVISSILQSEIDDEIEDRKDADSVLQSQITDISAKIKGGVVYQGMVSTNRLRDDDVTISALLMTVDGSTIKDEIRSGFMYVNSGHLREIEGHKIGNGDYIYVNIDWRGEQSIQKSQVTGKDVSILDAMDSRVYDLIGEISSKVESISDRIDNLNASYNFEGSNDVSIITNVLQDKGQISIESRKLISSDVTGLKDFVENEISLSVKNMKSSIGEEGQFVVSVSQEDGKLVNPVYSKITDVFIDDDAISQNKVNNLTVDLFNISSELSTIERRRRGDVSLMGDFVWPETVSPAVDLSNFLKVATESSFDKILRKGFLYRFPVDQSLKRNGIEKSFVANDYVLVGNDVVLSDAEFESFDYIRDFQKQIDNDVFHLTADNSVSGTNIFDGTVKIIGKTRIDSIDTFISGFSADSSYARKSSAQDLKVTNRADFNGQVHLSSDKVFIDDASTTLKDLSDDFQTQITKNKNSISDISSHINGLSCNNTIVEGDIITSLSQSEGQITYEKTKLLSSHVEGLSDYVQEQIKLSVEAFDSEISSEGKVAVKVSMIDGKLDFETSKFDKITDEYVETISQSKVSGLVQDLFNISSDLSTVIIRNRGDVSLMGDFVWYDQYPKDITEFLFHNTKEQWDYILRKGFLYRFSQKQTLKSGDTTKDFVSNDYVLTRNDVVLSDATFESFDYINDYDGDIESLNDRIDNLNQDVISAEHGYIIDSIWEDSGIVSASTRRLVSSDVENLEEFVKSSIEAERSVTHANYASLSGNNVISNHNEFTGSVKMDSLSVAFDRVYDTLDKYLSSDLPSLENPKILGIGERINDIIILSELPIDRIEDFNSAIVDDLVVKTKQIYVQAYSETAPEITKFSQMIDILNGVLVVLKVKGTGLTLQSRLNLLHKNIELVSKYVDTLNADLANLCVHVNLSCQEIKDGISEISSNLNTLSSDYKGLKDSTFHKFDDATHISSYGLIITDADHPEDTKPHDRYVMTFLSGTLVLEKI